MRQLSQRKAVITDTKVHSQSLYEGVVLDHESVTILFPTKSRPERVRAMIDSCLSKADFPELIRFVSYIDYGDIDSIPSEMTDNIEIIKGKNVVIANVQHISSNSSSRNLHVCSR